MRSSGVRLLSFEVRYLYFGLHLRDFIFICGVFSTSNDINAFIFLSVNVRHRFLAICCCIIKYVVQLLINRNNLTSPRVFTCEYKRHLILTRIDRCMFVSLNWMARVVNHKAIMISRHMFLCRRIAKIFSSRSQRETLFCSCRNRSTLMKHRTSQG